ncbi:MAG: endonuclease, partial [Bacteroidales bacterium]|nr:endonuclease [Bacteroidales bacterium]
TYAGNLPWLRIDYFFLSKHLKATSSNVIQLPFSDHYPVQVRIIPSSLTP